MASVEQLKEWKMLLDQGAISEEEYLKLKEEVLNILDGNGENASGGMSAIANGNSGVASSTVSGTLKRSDNPYATALQILGLSIIMLGSLGSIFIATSVYDYKFTIFCTCIFTVAFTGILVLGLGEIINILSENRKLLSVLVDKTTEEHAKSEVVDQ